MEEEIVSSYEELMEVLFKSEGGEYANPKPYTYILYTQVDYDAKKTVNDFVCIKGEEAIQDYMNYISPTREIRLIKFKMNIVNAEALLYHPFIRLREYPTLMSVDGCRRLEGCDVANRNLLNLFFEELDTLKGANPSFRVVNYSPLLRAIDIYKNYWKYANDEEYTQPHFAYPDFHPGRTNEEIINIPETHKMREEFNFWNVRAAVIKKSEAQAEMEGIAMNLDLKTEEASKIIEEKIRNEFIVKTVKEVPLPAKLSVESKPEEAGDIASGEKTEAFGSFSGKADQEIQEPIIPFNLDQLCLKKETQEIERKPKILPAPPTGGKKKKKKGKGKGKAKKGKKGGPKGKQKGGPKGKKKGKGK